MIDPAFAPAKGQGGAPKEDLMTKVIDYVTQSTSNNEGTLLEIQDLLEYVSVNYPKG